LAYYPLKKTVEDCDMWADKLIEEPKNVEPALMTSNAAQVVKKSLPKSHPLRIAILLAMVAGLFLIASGVTSGSIIITGLNYVDTYLGPQIGSGQILVQIAIAVFTLIVGFGGLLVILGGLLLWREHGSSGRFFIGLGGGTAILGLLFSMAEALYFSGLSAPVFHQTYFTLYWIGAILATASILFSRRAPATKPII
jgi:hypothetical protein